MKEETAIHKKGLKQKHRKILLITGIVAIILLLMGVSYAWWNHTAFQESVNEIDTDCLKLTITDEVDEKGKSTAIKLENAYPITDAEASLLKPYEFRIQNTCNTKAEYSVNLEIMKAENKLESKYVNIDFNKTGKKKLTEYTSVTPSYNKNGVEADEARHLTNGTLEPNESRSYSIRLWIDEKVTIEDDAMNKSLTGKISISSVLNQLATNNLSELIIRKSETDASIEKVEHEETEQTPALTDYRYTGKDPDNYVCFGYEGERCPDENLYRIIGVIPTQSSENGAYENRVKLIKASNYEGPNIEDGSNRTETGKAYHWNTSGINKWEESSLKEELNTEYWNSLGEYQKYIEKAKWYLGSNDETKAESYFIEQLYNEERSKIPGSNQGVTSYIDNIGLMYLSDYGYSILKEYWNDSIYNNQEMYKTNAWMYILNRKNCEWAITPGRKENRTFAWAVAEEGGIGYAGANDINWIFGARPTFYLKASVLYKKGEGTIDNPYYLAIE